MFFAFFSTVNSIFVPYSLTAESTVPRINATLLQQKAIGLKTVIGIGLKPDDKDTKTREETILEATYYYGDKADFYFLEPVSCDELAKQYGLSIPCVFVYRVGLLCGTYMYPESDSGIMFLLRLILEPMPEATQSLADLHSQLGNMPFALLATPERYNKAVSLQYDVSSQMNVGVIPVEPQVLLSLGINSSKLAFFRGEDRTVFQSSEFTEGLYAQSYPVYRSLMPSDLRGESTIVFALVAPELNDDYQEFLYQVGERAIGVVVGYLPRNLKSYAESICHVVIDEKTVTVVAFNYDNGFYYDTSSEFTPELLKKPINVGVWVQKANTIISKILLGQIKPEFISEPEPPKSTTNTQQLVGTTYEQFIMDPNYDVVVLYKREGCENCVEFFPQYLEFAASLSNYTYLKFAYIDILKNSCKLKYPFMPGVPHVHFYPAHNKSADVPMRGGRSTNSMLRMIKQGSKNKYDFEAPPMDKASAAMELFTLLFAAKDMPPDEQAKAMEYIQELNDKMNMTTPEKPKEQEPDLTKEL